MKILTLILIFVLSTACLRNRNHQTAQENPERIVEDTTGQMTDTVRVRDTIDLGEYGIVLKPEEGVSYAEMKRRVQRIRSQINGKGLPADSLSELFTDILLNKIFPYWYGTKWSFEGHTAIPGQGRIACGYFVSTTLKDAGLNINRYRMAQQSPENEGKTLSLDKPLITIRDTNKYARIRMLKDTLQEGLYFIGFDQYHVGYLLKRKDELFLIHSNYLSEHGVMIEPVERSVVFPWFPLLGIAGISHNEGLLRKWVSNEAVKVVRN